MLLHMVILYTPAAPHLEDSTNSLRMKHLHRHHTRHVHRQQHIHQTKHLHCYQTWHAHLSCRTCRHTHFATSRTNFVPYLQAHTLLKVTHTFCALLAGTHATEATRVHQTQSACTSAQRSKDT